MDLKMEEIKRFIKYASYFHDGSLINIKQIENSIEILMSSAEMDPKDMLDNIPLANDNSIKGKLHLENVINIKVSDNVEINDLLRIYDDGTILDFELKDNMIELGILWTNFRPKSPTNDFSIIKIVAKKIWWENIPNLDNSFG
jgi:hypothetical protein